MIKSQLQVLCFLAVLAMPLMAFSQLPQSPEAEKCIQDLKFSDVSYDELKNKLATTLNEKNKSLIFMEFHSLQAQVDVMVTHLMMDEFYSKADATELLAKITTHLEQLEVLLAKAKTNAKIIKDEHVVPLATLTSLKAEYDNCSGINSQFPVIFKLLSQLNKDLNEILMLSSERITAQKETVRNLIRKMDAKNSGLTAKNIAEPLNFIQNQINTVTHTFEFDTKTLSLAKN